LLRPAPRISQSSEIAPDPGVALAGGLPGALALRTVYAAAVLAGTEAARAFVRFLATAPAARTALSRAGFAPASGDIGETFLLASDAVEVAGASKRSKHAFSAGQSLSMIANMAPSACGSRK
jgi:hypothetical protein